MSLAIFVGVGLLFGVQMLIADASRIPLVDETGVLRSGVATNDQYKMSWEECNIIIDFTARCINVVIEQNNIIIQKIDWSNCVLKHKKSFYYEPPNSDIQFMKSQNYDDLVEHCGEMP